MFVYKKIHTKTIQIKPLNINNEFDIVIVKNKYNRCMLYIILSKL